MWKWTIWYSLLWYMVGQEISYYGSDHAIHKLVRAHVLLTFFSFWDPFWTQLFHKTFQWFLTQQNFKRWSQWLRSSPTLFNIFSVCELGSIKPWGWIWDLGSEQSQDPWPIIQGSPDLTQASFNLCDLLSTSATNSFPHFEFYRLCCSLLVSFGQFKLTCCCGVIVAF